MMDNPGSQLPKDSKQPIRQFCRVETIKGMVVGVAELEPGKYAVFLLKPTEVVAHIQAERYHSSDVAMAAARTFAFQQD